jgi:hypothetical protein
LDLIPSIRNYSRFEGTKSSFMQSNIPIVSLFLLAFA